MENIEELLNKLEYSALQNNTKEELKNILYGFDGERNIRKILTENNIHYFQADLLFSYNDKWYLCEVKHQDIFVPPPFYGHGLPPWQVKARLKFQSIFGIRTILFVVDKESKKIYFQWLDVLDKGKRYFSHTGKRVIYPIDNFLQLEDSKQLIDFLSFQSVNANYYNTDSLFF